MKGNELAVCSFVVLPVAPTERDRHHMEQLPHSKAQEMIMCTEKWRNDPKPAADRVVLQAQTDANRFHIAIYGTEYLPGQGQG